MNYIIEENFNFYDLLNDEDENDDEEKDENNICLITNEKLTDYFVTMECGHKFNYIPLYKDLFNHKYILNYMENYGNRLLSNEIRCPYCRKKSTELLPFYDLPISNSINVRKIIGINQYQIQNPKSGLSYKLIFQERKLWNNEKKINDKAKIAKAKEDAKLAKLKAKEEIKLAKLKAKEETKLAKLKAREEVKLAKLKAKEEVKLAKLKAKEEAKLAKLKLKEETKL